MNINFNNLLRRIFKKKYSLFSFSIVSMLYIGYISNIEVLFYFGMTLSLILIVFNLLVIRKENKLLNNSFEFKLKGKILRIYNFSLLILGILFLFLFIKDYANNEGTLKSYLFNLLFLLVCASAIRFEIVKK